MDFMLNIIFGVLCFSSFITGACFIGAVFYMEEHYEDYAYKWSVERKNTYVKKKMKSIILAMCISVTLLFISASFNVIKTGYSGVLITFGQVSEKTLNTGINFKVPFIQSIKTINIKQQDTFYNVSIFSETVNRTDVTISNINVTYQYGSDKVSWLMSNVSNSDKLLISPDMLASCVKDASKTLKDEDVTSRSIIEPLVLSNLQLSANEKYGEGVVKIIFIAIQDIDYSAEYNQAIADKQNAILSSQTQEINNQRAIDTAEASAKAKLIEANATAESNKITSQSITENILTSDFIEKWNGELSKVSGASSGMMFDVSALLSE